MSYKICNFNSEANYLEWYNVFVDLHNKIKIDSKSISYISEIRICKSILKTVVLTTRPEQLWIFPHGTSKIVEVMREIVIYKSQKIAMESSTITIDSHIIPHFIVAKFCHTCIPHMYCFYDVIRLSSYLKVISFCWCCDLSSF